ncbi:MAG: cytochrome b/b6 domain-containing protein [Bradyrhizobium sp.]|uniref:cytochrome b/b6 domain-containing protein n=1 Tax=Bradyrhizobium sp. TaxID=376 RepID=UPI003D0C2E76
MRHSPTVPVWDPLVRIFHWLLVAGFFTAYLTEDDFMTLHAWAGYLVLSLLAFRLAWGFVGPRHARFSDFVAPPGEALRYLGRVVTGRAPRHLGHNPAGGLMIVALLVGLVLTGASGLVVYGVEEQAGPLAAYVAHWPRAIGKAFEEVHEFLANGVLLLVFVHVAGVIVESLLHRENLVKAMWTGEKRLN